MNSKPLVVAPVHFLSITGMSTGDTFGYLEKRIPEMNLLQKAYCVALFDRLYKEFMTDLSNQIGEERAYLLAEYQTATINDFTKMVNNMREAMKREDAEDRDKKVGEALQRIKDANSDVEGFQDSEDNWEA